MKKKPEIGQIVFSLNVGNAARRCKQELTPLKVTKVGRVYFTAGEGWQSTQYRLDDWSEKSGEYIARSVLYETAQEWEDSKQIKELSRQINLSFGYDHCNIPITLVDAMAIVEILNRYKK